jgi:UDP-GlcNAc3NAcA epimerase
MRPETEWTETVEDGWNLLVGTDREKILQGLVDFQPQQMQKNHYGDGHAGEKIAELLTKA